MKTRHAHLAWTIAAALFISGCATGPDGNIYVPPEQKPESRKDAPIPPEVRPKDSPIRKSEQPPQSVPEVEDEDGREESGSPSYQEQGEPLSPAAASLMKQADTLLRQDNPRAAVSQLERAQRISPRSAEVYYKLSEAYVAMNRLEPAEQFTLKGLSLAGNNTRLQRSGWQLLADIRRANGNTAGADQAEARAAKL
ncbi:tetratricopeptide repeat protein [Marinobacter salicampi]|uniref:tetratricopeptide repeat protein n=1 Tax=Marinobacter salicampi TaxID=435907 RepID=UPI0014092E48|nr:tetratricopeptide repeat protein [Marinobacter salicampi]